MLDNSHVILRWWHGLAGSSGTANGRLSTNGVDLRCADGDVRIGTTVRASQKVLFAPVMCAWDSEHRSRVRTTIEEVARLYAKHGAKHQITMSEARSDSDLNDLIAHVGSAMYTPPDLCIRLTHSLYHDHSDQWSGEIELVTNFECRVTVSLCGNGLRAFAHIPRMRRKKGSMAYYKSCERYYALELCVSTQCTPNSVQAFLFPNGTLIEGGSYVRIYDRESLVTPAAQTVLRDFMAGLAVKSCYLSLAYLTPVNADDEDCKAEYPTAIAWRRPASRSKD